METMNDLDTGVRAMYHDYCHGDAGKDVLVVAGRELESADDAALLTKVLAALEPLANSLRCMRQDDAPLDAAALDAADVVILFGKTRSVYRREVLEYLREPGRRPSVHRCFDFSPQLFQRAFSTPQRELDALNGAIIAAGMNARAITVRSDAGTELRIQLHPRHQWTNSCGRFNGRFPAVLPAGEVNTYPARVDGTLVCDGAVNCSIGFPRSVLFTQSPLILRIENSVVIDYHCEDPLTMLFMEQWGGLENSLRVGEAGFGTNAGCREFVDFCSHLNERHPGLHIGLGTPTQSASNVSWTSPVHLDLIPRDTRIDFDDVRVFHDGRYLREPMAVLAAAQRRQTDVVDVDAV